MFNQFGGKLDSTPKLLILATIWMTVAISLASAQTGANPSDSNQPYVPTLTFDVASIRESPVSNSYMVGGSFQSHSSLLRVKNFDLMNLLAMAYDIRWDQITGAPDWHTMFNIEAKSDSTADERLARLSKDQEELEHQHMLQALLADRFKLKVHWVTRQGPTYDLVVMKKGPRIQEAKGDSPSAEERKIWGEKPIPALYQRGDSQGSFEFVAHECSVSDITHMLAEQFGRPVSDRTGLSGKYSFTLRYHDTRLSDRSADDTNPVPTLDTAIQDQLGLKLEPAKGPIQFLVIDHVEKPSDN